MNRLRVIKKRTLRIIGGYDWYSPKETMKSVRLRALRKLWPRHCTLIKNAEGSEPFLYRFLAQGRAIVRLGNFMSLSTKTTVMDSTRPVKVPFHQNSQKFQNNHARQTLRNKTYRALPISNNHISGHQATYFC